MTSDRRRLLSAEANKVDAELIFHEHIRELEPLASGLPALHVKTTGIIPMKR